MKKAICAVAVVMVVGFAGQALAAGGKTPKPAAKKEVLTIDTIEKEGNWGCECECFPEDPPTEFDRTTRQVCHCQCGLADGSSFLWAKTEEKTITIRRQK